MFFEIVVFKYLSNIYYLYLCTLAALYRILKTIFVSFSYYSFYLHFLYVFNDNKLCYCGILFEFFVRIL